MVTDFKSSTQIMGDTTVTAQFALLHTHPVCGETCGHQDAHGDVTIVW